MVTVTEVGQLSGECSLWRDALRSFRNRFAQYQTQLTNIAASQSSRDVLLEIEHLDNQFHIQMINIHDIKQAIKKHMSRIGFERSNRGHVSDDTLARHEVLYDEYQRLDNRLHTIGNEFDKFANHVQENR